jgi:hypothetical protein
VTRFSATVKKVHPMWWILPYAVASALGTFPSLEGFVSLLIEWSIFATVFTAWRWDA